MKPIKFFLCICGVSIVASSSTSYLMASRTPDRPSETPDASDGSETLARLRERARTLEQRIEQHAAELDALSAVPPSSSRVAMGGDLDSIVARILESRSSEDAPAVLPEEALEPEEIQALLSELRRKAGSMDGQRIWLRLDREGKTQAVIEALRQRAEAAPRDLGAQVELGRAYFYAAMRTERPDYADAADAALDRALAIDENDWEARFVKAIGLSNRPALAGKGAEAIRQFEILIDQQSRGPQKDHHAQSYVYLGSMYEQTGDHEQAVSVWSQGLRNFPGHAGLKQLLGED